MSFARQRLALGVSSHLRALPRLNSAHSSLVAHRLLSTTPRRSHAEPINVKHVEPHLGHRLDPPGLRSPHGTALTAEDEPGKYVNPYAGGQSAIDKAVHLFFFTEILRGANIVMAYVSSKPIVIYRHVDCAGEFLPTAIHNHVSIREGSAFASFPRGACSSPLSQWRRTLYWLVHFN
jgi:hypothetical protein